MYLRSELLWARRYLAVTWLVCHITWPCVTPPEQVPGAACLPSVTGALLFQKNAGPNTAEVWTMNGLQMLPWIKNKLQIIFLSPRDRDVKALKMQDSIEAIHRQKKDHGCYVLYIKSPFSHTNPSFLLSQAAPHTFKLLPFSLWHEPPDQDTRCTW